MAEADSTTAAETTLNDPINMDSKRAKRFTDALFELENSVRALSTSAGIFQNFDPLESGLDAFATVEAFTASIQEKINLMSSMIVNEEHLTHPLES